MWSIAREIAAGDVIIIWMTRDSIQPLLITPGKELNGRFGVYRHDDLIGLPYGSKVASRNGRGFIHVLRPTPELWTLALPHRTQILYLADIAFITSWLGIKPGSIVIEAGTGSGSFSHSVARTVGSTGRLHSFEFHELRVAKARMEFARHGIADIVNLTHRNVCKDGFSLCDAADAVFLDLPAPWEAVHHAKAALRKDKIGRICCFSPCIEQVLRTVTALNDAGFSDITMYETLSRPHEVSQVQLQTIGQITQKLKTAEVRKEEKRLKQIMNAREANAARKRKRDDTKPDQGETGPTIEEDTHPDKRTKTHADMPATERLPSTDGPHPSTSSIVQSALTPVPSEIERQDRSTFSAQPALGAGESLASTLVSQPQPDETALGQPDPGSTIIMPPKSVVSRPFPEVRGHTSYLTFACLIPSCPTVIDNSPSYPEASPLDTMSTRDLEQ